MNPYRITIVIMAIVALSTACNDPEEPTVPSITEVRNSTGVITSAKRGEVVMIVGENLAELTSVKFNGREADLATAILTGKMATVSIPADAPTSGSNKLEVANADGGDAISFTILPGDDANKGKLCINEVYYSNPDWIELYNGTNAEIDLSGYFIRDDKGESEQFVVPSGKKIAAGGFLVFDEATDFTFGISSTSGDQLTLYDPSGSIVDDVILAGESERRSFGRTTDGGISWKHFQYPTKGISNTTVIEIPVVDYTGLSINEAYSRGKGSVDPGLDWVELYNDSDAAIDLSGLLLADKEDKSDVVVIASGTTIAAKGFLVVEVDVAGGFGLSSSGDKVWLFDPDGAELDYTEFGAMDEDKSWSAVPDGSDTFRMRAITKGKTNKL